MLRRLIADNYVLTALPVDLRANTLSIAVVTLKNRTLSPVVDRFIECAREVSKALVKGQAPSGRAKSASARNSQNT